MRHIMCARYKKASSCLTLSLLATLIIPAQAAQPDVNQQRKRVNVLEENRPLPPGPGRWNEDYRFLDDPAKRTDFWDPIRYHRLSDSAWIQTGAEVRYRADHIRNPVYGLRGVDKDNFIQQRLQLHSDLHLFDDRLRFFVQLENTRSWNKALYAATDESKNELRQAFFDINGSLLDGRLVTRVGRQELGLGSFVFTNYRDSRNIRLGFDGVRLSYTRGPMKLDAFGLRPIVTGEGSFDDGSNNNVKFYGLYGSAPVYGALKVDAYLFGLETEERALAGLRGREERYTAGVRVFGERHGWDWSWDFAHQSGTLAGADIAAWAVSSESGYTLDGPFKPRLALRIDAASGDDKPGDNKVQVFDPLYPKNGVYGGSGVNTLSNMILIGPRYTFSPTRHMDVELQAFAAWRENKNDGVYLPGMTLVPGTQRSSASRIGTIYNGKIRWALNNNITAILEYGQVQAGSAIEQAGGSDMKYGSLTTVLRF